MFWNVLSPYKFITVRFSPPNSLLLCHILCLNLEKPHYIYTCTHKQIQLKRKKFSNWPKSTLKQHHLLLGFCVLRAALIKICEQLAQYYNFHIIPISHQAVLERISAVMLPFTLQVVNTFFSSKPTNDKQNKAYLFWYYLVLAKEILNTYNWCFTQQKTPTFWPTSTVTTWGLKGHISTSVREEQLQVTRAPFPSPIGTLSDHTSSI